MAGNLPDPVGDRFAYDIDGTFVGYVQNFNAPSVIEMNLSQKQVLNNESGDTLALTNGNNPYGVIFIFPEARDVNGIYIAATNSGTRSIEYSTNTTNGLDGDWSSAGSWTSAVELNNSLEGARSNVISLSLTNVKGLRVRKADQSSISRNRQFAGLHLYGVISQSSRTKLWHPTLDEPIAFTHLDFGDVPRNQVVTRQFRVKNMSSTLSASDIHISANALTDGGSQTTVQAISFSDDGSSFDTSTSISSLGPGEISGIRHIRYSPSDLAILGSRIARVLMVVGSWD